MAAIAAVGCLAFAASALGVTEPTDVSTSSPRNLSTAPWTFSWGAATPGDGEAIAGYVGGATTDPLGAPVTPLGSGTSGAVAVAETDRYFRVAAILEDGQTGPYATLPILPDYTAPAVSAALTGTANAAGWYRELTVTLTCSDEGGGPVSCPDITWAEDGEFGAGARTASATDSAGNTTTIGLPAFNFDATRPNPGTPTTTYGQPLSPGPQALVAEEPLFSWTRGLDERSGVARYELRWRLLDEDDWTTMNDDVPNPAVGDPSAKRLASTPELPVRTPFEWQVVTYDQAGNFRASSRQTLTIDPTIPPAPTITGGPAAPTKVSSPTFSWTGAEETYLWDVTLAGAQNPLRLGGGPATQTTVQNLPDGDYTFRVSQVTRAGRESAEATRSFKVDTTPPAPPTILVRPPFPAIASPVFTWATEPGAYSRWVVLDGAGNAVIPVSDTPAASVTLPTFPDGAYNFQLQQIDAAGNVSAPSVEPFTMLAPLTPAPSPSNAAAVTVLPRQNAVRLKPKAGQVVPTRAPVLRWTRGPKGTKLYNLQVFRVVKRRGSAPKIRKVLSVFPRGLQMRAPKSKLTPGTCYVWRVWPYTGRAFTPKPVGVSNFCVASAKVIKLKQKQARARKIAAARARLARSR
jgi:hypothetical protein